MTTEVPRPTTGGSITYSRDGTVIAREEPTFAPDDPRHERPKHPHARPQRQPEAAPPTATGRAPRRPMKSED